MKRTIINIDEEKCNGCGSCITGCHEGALQMIDGKARLVSELFCDGLGACIGDCPEGAITLEEREAEPYNEYAVMDRVSAAGENVILAHMKHLKDHNETGYLGEAITYLNEHGIKVDLSKLKSSRPHHQHGGGCPGSAERVFAQVKMPGSTQVPYEASALTHWPVQMHLINPGAAHFAGSDLLLAADCTAFSLGGFHSRFLQGKTLAIACPKLDSNLNIYVEKLTALIDEAKINSLTIMIMEVPCCGGLVRLVQQAMQNAHREIPVEVKVVSVTGEIYDN
jgi:ferredoxin